jgi:hypothetical protein
VGWDPFPLPTEGAAEYTDIEIPLLVTFIGVVQGAFDVSTTVTVWPFVRPAVVYVALLVPTFDPLTFH